MNISSLIVGARPERVNAVCNALRGIDGVELHAATPQGQLIVTVETESDGLTTELFARIGALDGVVDVAMVYHQFEPDPHQEVRHESDAS